MRILKHVINDVARLRSILKEKHLENEDAIEHILKFFCALDIEVRAGKLSRELLLDRMNRLTGEEIGRASADNTKDTKPLSKIISRYPSADLKGSILSDEILEATLIDGRFDSEMIARWLDQTYYFIQESETPPWRIVMKFDALDDEILNEGINRMQKQFDERAVTVIGEFLHIAALRLMMVEQDIVNRTLDEEVSLCKKYIDDLLASRELPPKSLEYITEIPSSSYGGYGYWVSEAVQPYFDAIRLHVDKAQHQALEDTYPKHIEEILRQLKDDQKSIIQTLSSINPGNITFAFIPILAHIPVDTFLDAWLSGPRNGWLQTTMALSIRYGGGQLDGLLKNEKPWLVKLEREINVRIKNMTGFDAFRLERLKPRIFRKCQVSPDHVSIF